MTDKTKFTEGPWELVSRGWDGRVVNGSDGNWIADLTLYHDTSEANAHLIASAPDLYEALEEMLKETTEMIKLGECDSDWCHDGRILATKALAKARGE